MCYLFVEEITTAKLNVSIYFYADSHSKVDGISTSAKASSVMKSHEKPEFLNVIEGYR